MSDIPQPRTARGLLAMLARHLGVIHLSESFSKTPDELLALIGDRSGIPSQELRRLFERGGPPLYSRGLGLLVRHMQSLGIDVADWPEEDLPPAPLPPPEPKKAYDPPLQTIVDRARSGGVGRMSFREFVDAGYLQEANRLFFHPRGLALGVTFLNGSEEPLILGPVLMTDDKEGYEFGETSTWVRSLAPEARRQHCKEGRQHRFGSEIEPLAPELKTSCFTGDTISPKEE